MVGNRPRIFLVDEVVDELRQRVLRGDYPPGSRLRQEQVAQDLDLSRTPVREAMRTLAQEGLLTAERSGGMRVAERSPENLLAAYELRVVLDGLAARLAAGTETLSYEPELLASLRRQQEILDGTWSADAWTKANIHFHGLIIDASHNPYLQGLRHFVGNTSQVFRPMSILGRGRAETALNEHTEIFNALVAGEVDHAEALAHAHIRSTISALAKEIAHNKSSEQKAGGSSDENHEK